VLGLALAAAATAASLPARAAPDWAATRTLKADTGSAVAGAPLAPGEAVHVAVTLRLRHPAEMDAVTSAILAGRSTHPLTRAEVLAHYAPTPAQVDAVVAHLRAAGFGNVVVAGSRLLVSADGDAAAVQAAFHVGLRHFTVDGRPARANTGDALVPASLAGIVETVLGLQTVNVTRTMLRLPDPQDRRAAGGVIGHDPTEFPSIYGADALPSAKKATIAILSEGDISQTLVDLKAFAAEAGYPEPDVTQVIVGEAGTDTSGTVEWNMDSQSSLAAAGGTIRNMTFYVATNLEDAPLTEAYDRAVSDDTAQVINVSLGECENVARKSGLEAADDAIFQLAVAQGQVFSVAAGDSGSYQCNGKTAGQAYPAVSPYVMAVGGTTLTTRGHLTWDGETAWSCINYVTCKLLGGTGGGPSATEAAPSWQVDSGVLHGGTMRSMPDVALDGDPASGALVLVGDQHQQVGGTSLSAPLFAGFWARLQSDDGLRLTYPAAALYHFAPSKAGRMGFHDITSGGNGGYETGPGFDPVSGFGSLDVGKLDAFLKKHAGF
jgi:pseudomonalisin/xanthomonalisin